MKKIIHFANDEKFIDKAFAAFKQFENTTQSDFYIFNKLSQLKYIKFKCKVVENDFFKQTKIEEILNSYDLIVIHFLDSRYFDLLKNNKVKTKIIWIGWGGDYYWLINTLPYFSVYKNATKKHLGTKDNLLIKSIKKYKYRKRVRLLNRIDFFSPVLEEDYLLIKKNYRDFKPQFIEWNYGNLEDDYIIEGINLEGDAILVGNSATSTNNHYDVFHIIHQLNLGENQIIVPLSYGERGYKERFKMFLTQQGYMNNNIVLLEDFVPFVKYQQLLSKCGNVFMGHIRQQAMGNIIFLLYLGAKIFFFKESIAYQYFQKKGILVFSYDDLKKDLELLNKPLNLEVINNNRKTLIQYWGRDINRKFTSKIIDL